MTAPSRAPRAAHNPGSVRGPAVDRNGLTQFFDRLEQAAAGTDGLPRLLTAHDVAEVFGVKYRTAVFWATRGELSGVRGARSSGWRFTVADVKTFATRYYVVATT